MAANPPVRPGEKTIMVYAEQLKENPANHRFDFGDVTGLGSSFIKHGIRQALRVKLLKEKTDDGYPMYLVMVGNRRCRAAKKVADKMEEGDFVPVIVVPSDWTLEQCIADSIITDFHNKTRNLLELAYDFKTLRDGDAKMKQNAMARDFGISAQYVTDALFLIDNASETMIAQIKKGTLAPYAAIDLLRIQESDVADEIVLTAAKNKKKKEAEEQVINPDKKANTKTTLKKSELKEAAAGKPISLKDKKKASTSAAETSNKQAGGDQPKKDDPAVIKLEGLKAMLKANSGTMIVPAMNALIFAIKYLKGTVSALEAMPKFFEDEDAAPATEEVEEVAAPAKKGKKEAPAAKAPTKAAKGKKHAAPVEDEPDEDELEEIAEDNDDSDWLE